MTVQVCASVCVTRCPVSEYVPGCIYECDPVYECENETGGVCETIDVHSGVAACGCGLDSAVWCECV